MDIKKSQVTSFNAENLLCVTDEDIYVNPYIFDCGQVAFYNHSGPYAVFSKCLSDRKCQEDLISTFVDDIKVLNEFQHQSILCVLGWCRWTDYIAIVVEHVAGGSLASVLGSIELHPLIQLRLCCDIANGLTYFHQNNIVHGNISCNNIFLSDDLHCKIGFPKQTSLFIDFDDTVSVDSISSDLDSNHSTDLDSNNSVLDSKSTFAVDIQDFAKVIFQMILQKDFYSNYFVNLNFKVQACDFGLLEAVEENFRNQYEGRFLNIYVNLKLSIVECLAISTNDPANMSKIQKVLLKAQEDFPVNDKVVDKLKMCLNLQFLREENWHCVPIKDSLLKRHIQENLEVDKELHNEDFGSSSGLAYYELKSERDNTCSKPCIEETNQQSLSNQDDSKTSLLQRSITYLTNIFSKVPKPRSKNSSDSHDPHPPDKASFESATSQTASEISSFCSDDLGFRELSCSKVSSTNDHSEKTSEIEKNPSNEVSVSITSDATPHKSSGKKHPAVIDDKALSSNEDHSEKTSEMEKDRSSEVSLSRNNTPTSKAKLEKIKSNKRHSAANNGKPLLLNKDERSINRDRNRASHAATTCDGNAQYAGGNVHGDMVGRDYLKVSLGTGKPGSQHQEVRGYVPPVASDTHEFNEVSSHLSQSKQSSKFEKPSSSSNSFSNEQDNVNGNKLVAQSMVNSINHYRNTIIGSPNSNSLNASEKDSLLQRFRNGKYCNEVVVEDYKRKFQEKECVVNTHGLLPSHHLKPVSYPKIHHIPPLFDQVMVQSDDYQHSASQQEHKYLRFEEEMSFPDLASNLLKTKFTALVGFPGSGKTTLAQHLQIHLNKKPDILAVLILCSRLNSKKKVSCKSFFIKNLNLGENIYNYMKDNPNKCVLLFDGLDQLNFKISDCVDYECEEEALEMTSILALLLDDQFLKDCHIFVTSRPSAIFNLCDELHPDLNYFIHDFSADQTKKLFIKVIGFKKGEEIAHTKWRNLKTRTPQLYSACLNPLFLWMYIKAIIYPSKEINNTSTLSRTFATIWLKMSLNKNVKNTVKNSEYRDKLAKLAYQATKQNSVIISGSDLQCENIIHERVKDLLIMVDDLPLEGNEKGNFMFFHQTFQEYLAARYIAVSMTDLDFDTFLKSLYSDNDKWSMVRSFLFGYLFDILPLTEKMDRKSKCEKLCAIIKKHLESGSESNFLNICIDALESNSDEVKSIVVENFPEDLDLNNFYIAANAAYALGSILEKVTKPITSLCLSGCSLDEEVFEIIKEKISILEENSIGTLNIRNNKFKNVLSLKKEFETIKSVQKLDIEDAEEMSKRGELQPASGDIS